MARTLTAIDACSIVNLLVAEMTGQDASIQTVDSSNFVSVGETILRSGTENVLNTLSLVLGRTFMAVRPYKAKLILINALETGLYTDRMRKISYYSRNAQESGAFNTDQNTNFAMGYDNGSNGGASLPTMWEQNTPIPFEYNFGGRSVWDDSTTIYEVQLQQAFRSPEDFAAFVNGIMVEKGNDIESQKEAFNRMTLLNYMAGIYDLNGVNNAAIDMTAAYNVDRALSPAVTTAQILSTPSIFDDFLRFFVETVKILSDQLTHRSIKYHWSPTKTIGVDTYDILRHTPKDRQKLILYKPFFIKAEATIMPGIFNPEYLKIENFEGVDYWQNENAPMAIDVTPAIPDTSDPTQQIAGTNVALDNVLGVLFDEDALLVDYQLEEAYSTPVEARKRYRNMWWHFAKNSINDFTENGILLYMG
ncbi:MAG: hypothetical protein J6S85_26560 [Methanobrevibacter sp.]|nr:hypothetical protein [Methanobrevibacter sp.]MBO7717157.1 hypothetical protein [Methanobrevibacter sp.]